jgi:hypothetical protein
MEEVILNQLMEGLSMEHIFIHTMFIHIEVQIRHPMFNPTQLPL